MKIKDENTLSDFLAKLNTEEIKDLTELINNLERDFTVFNKSQSIIVLNDTIRNIFHYLNPFIFMPPLPNSILTTGQLIITRDSEESQNILNLKPLLPKTPISSSTITKIVRFDRYTGEITYDKYKAIFPPESNEYLILCQLIDHPNKLLSSEELNKELNPPRNGAEDTLPDKRVRDTIQRIKQKLGIDKNNPDNFFVVKNKKYRIIATIEPSP